MLDDARQLFQAPAESPVPQTRRQQLTLLDLVAAVASEARTEAEVMAVVSHLIESGTVKRACSRGGRFVIDRS
jgi:hypothetical protein